MSIEIARRNSVLALLLLVALATWTSVLDTPAMSQVDAGMKRALATFAVARALNAAISLAQGTEVSAGIGAELTLSVGQVLDPINDMVESFSNLMLMASVAFGIEKVLLVIGQHQSIKWLLMAVLVAWGLLYGVGKRRMRWLDQLLLLMLMLRFAVPLVSVGNDLIYAQFLQQEYQQDTLGLDASVNSVSTTTQILRSGSSPATTPAPAPVPQPSATPPTSWFDSMLSTISQTAAKFDPRPYLEQLKQQAGQAIEHMINLIVLFLIQTVLVPLFLLWAVYFALRSAVSGPGGA